MRMTLFLIFCLACGVVSFAYYMGGFNKIEFKKGLGPDRVLVFKKMSGSYKNTGAAISEISTWLRQQGIRGNLGFGLYFDNPSEVEEKDLRSVVGCILEKNDHERIEEIDKRFHVKHIPAKEALISSFPYKNKLSILFGVMKIYSALQKEKVDKGPVMEIYDIPNGKIDYYLFGGQLNYLLTEYYLAY